MSKKEEGSSSGEGEGEGEGWQSEEIQSSGEDWEPGREEEGTDSEEREARSKKKGAERVKRKLEFDQGERGRRRERGNKVKSRRLYSVGRGRGRDEKEGGYVSSGAEGGGPSEGDTEESGGDDASSSGPSIVAPTPPKVRVVARKAKVVARKATRTRTKFHCSLGCKGVYVRLAQHYQSKKHALGPQEAKQLAAKRELPLKTKDGHYRRMCSVPGCGSITARIADHIRRQHPEISSEDRKVLSYTSKRILEPVTITPLKAPTPTSTRSRVYSPGWTPRRSPRLAVSPSSGSKRRIPDKLVSKTKSLFPIVKRFWEWQLSHLGGGRSSEMAERSALQVQNFFKHFGGIKLEYLSSKSFDAYVSHLEGEKKKPASILFYVRALLKFLEFLLEKSKISVGRHVLLRKALLNIQNSLARKSKQEKSKSSAEAYHKRLNPQIREEYFSSEYIQGIRQLMEKNLAESDYVMCRNYLITAITLWNGHRPAVLRNMRVRDVLRGEITRVPGEEDISERTYMCVSVSEHKTAQTWGAAIISLPPQLWLELQRFIRLIKTLFKADETSCVFLTASGMPFERSSGINHCLQSSYSRSGVQTKYPQAFSATATRRLITTECRSQDPASAALIAAQLCHSVAMADKTYAMKSRVQLSGKAVHTAKLLIRASALEKADEAGPSGLGKVKDVSPERGVDGNKEGGNDQGRVDDKGGEEEGGVEEGRGSKQEVWTAEKWPEPAGGGADDSGGAKSKWWLEDYWVYGEEGDDDWEEWEGEGEGEGEGEFGQTVMREGDTIEFRDLPGDRSKVTEMLSNLLQDLDWVQILEDATFWVEHRSQHELAQSTSVLKIADSLHEAMLSRFDLNLFQILESEGAMPHGETMDVRFTMVALAACRLGVLFGSDTDPNNIPRQSLEGTLQEGSLDAREEARVEEERFALLPGEEERIKKSRDVDEMMRDEIRATMEEYRIKEKEYMEETRRRGMGSVAAHPPSPTEEGAGRTRKMETGLEEEGEEEEEGLGSSRKWGVGLEKVLRDVYGAEIEQCVETGGKMLMADVRRKAKEVTSLFPDLTIQQIRDKIFTICAQIRRRRSIGEGKGKGKGKKSKK